MGPYVRTWALNKDFLAIWVLIRSLFLVNSPYISEKCCQECYFVGKLGLRALGLITNFNLTILSTDNPNHLPCEIPCEKHIRSFFFLFDISFSLSLTFGMGPYFSLKVRFWVLIRSLFSLKFGPY